MNASTARTCIPHRKHLYQIVILAHILAILSTLNQLPSTDFSEDTRQNIPRSLVIIQTQFGSL